MSWIIIYVLKFYRSRQSIIECHWLTIFISKRKPQTTGIKCGWRIVNSSTKPWMYFNEGTLTENMNNTLWKLQFWGVCGTYLIECVSLAPAFKCAWKGFLMVPQYGSDSSGCQDWAIWNVSLLADESQELKQKWSSVRQEWTLCEHDVYNWYKKSTNPC